MPVLVPHARVEREREPLSLRRYTELFKLAKYSVRQGDLRRARAQMQIDSDATDAQALLRVACRLDRR